MARCVVCGGRMSDKAADKYTGCCSAECEKVDIARGQAERPKGGIQLGQTFYIVGGQEVTSRKPGDDNNEVRA